MTSATKKLLSLTGLVLAGTMISGCVGGTTYGTGVSQEQQTIEDFANILTFRKKRPDIAYQARPDLVVPEEKVLVEPQEQAVSTTETDWPETPEERIARVRGEAEEAQASTASENNFSRSEKNVRGVKPQDRKIAYAPIGKGIPNVTCDPEGASADMRRCTGGEISQAVRRERQEIKSVGKTGYQRRYLTEPPVAYRTPSDAAPIGDEGYSEEELAKIAAEEKKRRWEASTKPSS